MEMPSEYFVFDMWLTEHRKTEYCRASLSTLKQKVDAILETDGDSTEALRRLFDQRESELRQMTEIGYLWSELQAEPEVAFGEIEKTNPDARQKRIFCQSLLSLAYIIDIIKEKEKAKEIVICTDSIDSEELRTEKALAIWRKLYNAGFVDDHCMTKLDRPQSAFMAQAIATRLRLTSTWVLFEKLWNLKSMRTALGREDRRGRHRDFIEKLNRVLKG